MPQRCFYSKTKRAPRIIAGHVAVFGFVMLICAAPTAMGANTLYSTTSNAFVNISDIPSTASSESADIEYHLYGDPLNPTRQSRLVTESWWWWRFTGENDETIFHDPSSESYTSNSAVFLFDEDLFEARIEMKLFDGGFAEAILFHIRETDLSGAPIEGVREVNLFHNSDIELGHNVPDNDAANAIVNNRILVAGTDGPAYLYYENMSTSPFTYMIVDNDSTPDLEDLMADLLPTDYTNTGLPFAASDGDINLGYQWKFQLAPGEFAVRYVMYRLAVPEPAAILLALLGLALLPRRRRR